MPSIVDRTVWDLSLPETEGKIATYRGEFQKLNIATARKDFGTLRLAVVSAEIQLLAPDAVPDFLTRPPYDAIPRMRQPYMPIDPAVLKKSKFDDYKNDLWNPGVLTKPGSSTKPGGVQFVSTGAGAGAFEAARTIHDLQQTTGKGVAIGLIDTGCSNAHPALTGRFTFAEMRRDNSGVSIHEGEGVDYFHHGTATASQIVGADFAGVQLGGAPDAQLYVAGLWYRNDAKWDDLQVLTALDWLSDKAKQIKIICIPVEGGQSVSEVHEIALMATRRLGILPIVSAGNRGKGKPVTPGRCKHALSVGALNQKNELETTSSSTKATEPRQVPDLLAPGIADTARVDGPTEGPKTFTTRKLGPATSFAAPHVTAVAARLLQAYPSADPDQLQLALTTSPKTYFGDPGYTVAGVIDYDRAYAKLGSTLGVEGKLA